MGPVTNVQHGYLFEARIILELGDIFYIFVRYLIVYKKYLRRRKLKISLQIASNISLSVLQISVVVASCDVAAAIVVHIYLTA